MRHTRLIVAIASMLLLPALATAQERTPAWEGRGFVSATVGAQTGSHNFGYDYATPLPFSAPLVVSDASRAAVQVPGKNGASFDVGGGVRLVQNFGVGVTYSRYSKTRTAALTMTLPSLSLQIPDPTGQMYSAVLFNAGTIQRQIPLQREEEAYHIQAIYRFPVMHRLNAGVFGGPSFFRCLDDSVVSFSLEYPSAMTPDNWMTFGTVTESLTRDSTWGYHAGGDVTYMASRHVGVTFTARYSRASHSTPNVLSDVSQLYDRAVWGGSSTTTTVTMRHGGMQWHGGLTFRF